MGQRQQPTTDGCSQREGSYGKKSERAMPGIHK